MTNEEKKAIAIRSLKVVEDGTHEEFEELFHPDFYNREADLTKEPPATTKRGPEALWATTVWLREAFAEMRHEIQEAIVEDDLVAIHCIASGRHVGDMPLFDEDGAQTDVMAPTGKRFSTTQTHWVRLKDGKAIEHWASRDDLGTAKQLGWLPSDLRTYLRTEELAG